MSNEGYRGVVTTTVNKEGLACFVTSDGNTNGRFVASVAEIRLTIFMFFNSMSYSDARNTCRRYANATGYVISFIAFRYNGIRNIDSCFDSGGKGSYGYHMPKIALQAMANRGLGDG